MLAKKSWRCTASALLLSLHFLSSCPGAEISDIATQSGEIGGQYKEDAVIDDTPLQAEYVFELEKPLLPVPLAEEMPVSIPRTRPRISGPQPRNNYRYYYKRQEIEPGTVKMTMEELYALRNAERLLNFSLEELLANSYVPNTYEAESVAAHLKEARKNAVREACRNNLRLIASAVDSYFRDHPGEIIRSFDQNFVTSLNGRFVKYGYLKEPIKIPEGCRYVNESSLSELISGSQIYCTRHDNP